MQRPRAVRYAYPGREPHPISTVVFRASGVRWRGWGTAKATTGVRRFYLDEEGTEQSPRIRASLTLSRLRPRPNDGCGWRRGGRTYTLLTVRVHDGRLAGRTLRISLPATGCETV